MSHDYRQQVIDRGMIQSVGRTGVCWDNSVAESAWSSLKRELVHCRRLSTLGYIAPTTWEQQYHHPKANPAA